MNCSVYFYQWCVNSEHQHHFIITLHYSQKIFKVAVISYWNMSVYVQWIMNRILRLHCKYFCIYVDDIIIYFITLTKHIQHLQQIFKELAFKEICLLSEKFFLNYSFIYFLNQQVNILKLVTAEAKLIVIINLEFSHTLTQLKKYFEMTDYL